MLLQRHLWINIVNAEVFCLILLRESTFKARGLLTLWMPLLHVKSPNTKLPSVFSKDIMAAGLQEGRYDFIIAATAETCGQDMEVPEIIL
ncbi:hypothetical protein Patl1_30439 [Pistacia atlantica]|uniref:Uncharacterized protein n=1 Tax=Pistacia atlantica TaxID=434234 RepID=A0ACC1AA85_9ROSI|nr:hypothetical protein Patl1_30439 [Pistacia atlantica]